MTEILIIEDQEEKSNAIEQEVRSYFQGQEVNICKCAYANSATKQIFEQPFDMIVTDLMMPIRPGNEPTDFSETLLDHLSTSKANSSTVVVAITQFDTILQKRTEDFKRSGIFILDYQNDTDWRSCLKICMQRVEQRQTFDFAIICALEEERGGFRDAGGITTYGELSHYQGLNCRDIEIDGLKGVCVLQPRMGLVDAAVISSRILSVFRPRLICMAGICAGFKGEAELGTLLVTDPSWEHQAGKWSGGDFKLSHYQEPMENKVRTILSQMIEDEPSCNSLKRGLSGLNESTSKAAIIAPTVTGSAVIASTEKADQIKEQHRKVGGLDMEIYGLYRAATLHSEKVICFAAKTTVDLATETKGNDLHNAGVIFSARFVSKAVQRLLKPSENPA